VVIAVDPHPSIGFAYTYQADPTLVVEVSHGAVSQSYSFSCVHQDCGRWIGCSEFVSIGHAEVAQSAFVRVSQVR
jgi:hypothetical protein